MRRGLTLIELIFSMVIIAIVFTVVPKIIFASNTSLQLGIKEDALFNAITQIGMISKLPWDSNTIRTNGQIIGSSCSDTGVKPYYRIGGFEGSRNCLDYDGSGDWSVTMGQEDANYDDIDDYDGFSVSTSNAKVSYDLNTSVTLSNDLKTIVVTVGSASKKLGSGFQSSFFYTSANLGQIQINKRVW
jgi:prepilin-type N-terminal cleavage/methylation domain-containing protein